MRLYIVFLACRAGGLRSGDSIAGNNPITFDTRNRGLGNDPLFSLVPSSVPVAKEYFECPGI